MSYDFSNKVALVTGSGRGIGATTAIYLASLGADVVINFFRNRAPAEETAHAVEALGRKAHLVKADVGNPDDVARLIDETTRVFGGLDILVNNAASGYIRPILEQKVKGWDWTMNINARAALFLSQQAAPIMNARGGGSIVNVSSLGSVRTLPNYVVIGASKAALETVTKYCAVEFSPMNIVVNAVSPGVIETDALDHFENGRQMLDESRKRTPAGRNVTAEDVAHAIAFLCSPHASMIRGQTIVIDGGWLVATL